MKTFTFEQSRGFRLAAAAEFYAGFVPGSGMAAEEGEQLTFAFRLDRTFEAVAVRLRETSGTLVAEHTGTGDEDALRRQVARLLGLDADGDAWLDLGARDPVVGALQGEFPGFFTAAKPSPYDAATWGVISPRMSMKVAARIKRDLSRERGTAVVLGGTTHHVFPSPSQLLEVTEVPGLSPEKVDRLHGIAHAALEGKLDAERLRGTPVDEALAELQTLRGVGPWTAGHILFRGAALVDALPLTEPRVLHGLADVLGVPSVSAETFEQMAEGWRPFRMWVVVLLARHLARSGKWSSPGLARERAAAGLAMKRRRVTKQLSL